MRGKCTLILPINIKHKNSLHVFSHYLPDNSHCSTKLALLFISLRVNTVGVLLSDDCTKLLLNTKSERKPA